MGKQIEVLTDGRIGRQVTLQLPPLNYRATSNPQGRLSEGDMQEFCALYEKIRTSEFVPEGLLRIDFNAPRIGRRERWNYEGITSRHPEVDRLEPLCLVVLQTISEWTYCRIQTHAGRKQLVITIPYVAVYAKARPSREPGGPLPVPDLPETARRGYACVYSSDVQELTLAMDGTATLRELGR